MWKSQETEKGFTLIELLIVVAIIGILAAIAIPNLLSAMQRARQKRTMSDMRNLSVAWEARATEMNSFTAAGFSQADFVWPANALTFTELQSILMPTYIRSLPEKDAWGTVYDFGVDQPFGSDTASLYAVRSLGRGGSADTALIPGGTTHFSCDIIYSNGSFVTYPEGVVVN